MTRDEVIKGLERCMGKVTCTGCPLECMEDDVCALTLLQEAIALLKAEPKRGRWIINDNGEWACSECKYEPVVFENTPFCANCGVKMRDVKKKEGRV